MDQNSDEFKKLQAKWYEKLKKKGFQDIEQQDGNLKVWSSHLFKSSYNEITTPAKEDYYRIAGQFLHEYKFENAAEKLIWRLHSDGHSIRHIVQTLKKKGLKAHKNGVHAKIQRLARKMKCLIRET